MDQPPLPRTSVARSVCHQFCRHDDYPDDYGGGWVSRGRSGELTRQVPLSRLISVLEETRTREQRLRDLLLRVGGDFVLALGCFGRLRRVPQKLTARKSDGQDLPCPSLKALRDLRGDGTAAVRRWLVLLGQGHPPVDARGAVSTCSGRWPSTAALRSRCRNTRRNRGWLGKLKAELGVTGYPAIEPMTPGRPAPAR